MARYFFINLTPLSKCNDTAIRYHCLISFQGILWIKIKAYTTLRNISDSESEVPCPHSYLLAKDSMRVLISAGPAGKFNWLWVSWQSWSWDSSFLAFNIRTMAASIWYCLFCITCLLMALFVSTGSFVIRLLTFSRNVGASKCSLTENVSVGLIVGSGGVFNNILCGPKHRLCIVLASSASSDEYEKNLHNRVKEHSLYPALEIILWYIPIPVSLNSSVNEYVSLRLNSSSITAWNWLSDNSRCP